MESLSSIRSQIAAYIDGQIDYAGFRQWFVPVYADHAYAGESEELQLCRNVESQAADFSEGLVSEDELRSDLAFLRDGILPDQVLQRTELHVYPKGAAQAMVVTSTSTVLSPVGTVAGQFVGVGPALEYA